MTSIILTMRERAWLECPKVDTALSQVSGEYIGSACSAGYYLESGVSVNLSDKGQK